MPVLRLSNRISRGERGEPAGARRTTASQRTDDEAGNVDEINGPSPTTWQAIETSPLRA